MLAEICVAVAAIVGIAIVCAVKMPSTGRPALISLGLFGLSLCLPVGMFETGGNGDPGYAVLFLGWARIFGGGLDWLSWYANIAYGVAVFGLIAHLPRVSWAAGLVAVSLSLTMLLPFGRYDTYNNFDDYVLVGYWVWLAAIVVVPVTSFALMRSRPDPLASC